MVLVSCPTSADPSSHSLSLPSCVTFHCWEDADCAALSPRHPNPTHWTFDCAADDSTDDSLQLHLRFSSASCSLSRSARSIPSPPSPPSNSSTPLPSADLSLSPPSSDPHHLHLPGLTLSRPSTPASRTSSAPSLSSSQLSLADSPSHGRFSTSQVEEAAYLFWERKVLRDGVGGRMAKLSVC